MDEPEYEDHTGEPLNDLSAYAMTVERCKEIEAQFRKLMDENKEALMPPELTRELFLAYLSAIQWEAGHLAAEYLDESDEGRLLRVASHLANLKENTRFVAKLFLDLHGDVVTELALANALQQIKDIFRPKASDV